MGIVVPPPKERSLDLGEVGDVLVQPDPFLDQARQLAAPDAEVTTTDDRGGTRQFAYSPETGLVRADTSTGPDDDCVSFDDDDDIPF
jgi:hypothetical protein